MQRPTGRTILTAPTTGTRSTPQGRPPRYPIPRKTYIRWTPPANPNGRGIFSKGLLHNRERICQISSVMRHPFP